MATSEERLKILSMIEEGKLSAEEGARILSTLSEAVGADTGAVVAAPVGEARWLHVQVTDGTSGRRKVNVRVPLALVRSAVRLGARFAPDEVSGFDFDELVDAIQSGAEGKIAEVVDDDGDHVEVFVD